MDTGPKAAKVSGFMPDSDAAGAAPGADYPSPSSTVRIPSAGFIPGEGWYALPPILMAAGLWLGMLITHGTMHLDPGQRLKVPGVTKFTVKAPGRYILWDDYRTVWEGQPIDAKPILRAFDASNLVQGTVPDEIQAKETPGIQTTLAAPGELIFDRAFVTIAQLPGQQPVKQDAALHSRENVDGTTRVTLGSYHLPAAGEYELKVWGDFPERVFQLRKAADLHYYLGFIFGLGISLVGGLGAPALFLWIYIRRKQALALPPIPA